MTRLLLATALLASVASCEKPPSRFWSLQLPPLPGETLHAGDRVEFPVEGNYYLAQPNGRMGRFVQDKDNTLLARAYVREGQGQPMSALAPIERRIIDACLAGDDPKLATLRQQADLATVVSREHTGVGAYVKFRVPDAAPRLGPGPMIIDDVNLEVAGVPHGVATLLYVIDGALDLLELATFADPWPQEPEILSVGYLRETQTSAESFALIPVRERDPETLARAIGRPGKGDST